MIDFVYKLHDVIPSWPLGTRWTFHQLSDATQTSLPHVLQYVSEGLGKELDIASLLSQEEANVVLVSLSKKLQPLIEEREKEKAIRCQKAMENYEKLGEKIRVLHAVQNWHSAFRTLSYFAGQHSQDLPSDVFVTVCSDIIWNGIKSKTNLQELGQWLQKGVYAAMSRHTKDGIEEALDLIDAYGEYFLTEDSPKGPLLLGNILAVLEEPAAKFELWEQFKGLVDSLYPPH